MKLWKQLVVSFVVALVLPPLVILVIGLATGAGIGFVMNPMIYFLINPFPQYPFSGTISAFTAVVGIFLTNWLIVFLALFLFTHLWRGRRAN